MMCVIVVKNNTIPINGIVEKFNSVDPNIQFTFECETEGRLPFLDVMITKKNSNIETSVFHKPTAVDRCLHFKSNHPHSTFRGILKGAFIRSKRICSTEAGYTEESDRLFKMYLRFGYPVNWIRAAKNAVDHPTNGSHQRAPERTISIAYTKAFEPLKRMYAQRDIRLTARPTNTIRRRIYNLAAKSKSKWERNMVVYKYTCTCEKYYIGQTKRSLKTRIAEHKRSIKNKNKHASELADHIVTSGHAFGSDNFSIIDHGTTPYRTWIREGYHIQRAGEGILNRKEIRITETWAV